MRKGGRGTGSEGKVGRLIKILGVLLVSSSTLYPCDSVGVYDDDNEEEEEGCDQHLVIRVSDRTSLREGGCDNRTPVHTLQCPTSSVLCADDKVKLMLLLMTSHYTATRGKMIQHMGHGVRDPP